MHAATTEAYRITEFATSMIKQLCSFKLALLSECVMYMGGCSWQKLRIGMIVPNNLNAVPCMASVCRITPRYVQHY